MNLKDSVCDIQSINVASNNYLLCKDIVEYWCPEQRMKSHSVCVVIPALLIVVLDSPAGCAHVSPCVCISLAS